MVDFKYVDGASVLPSDADGEKAAAGVGGLTGKRQPKVR